MTTVASIADSFETGSVASGDESSAASGGSVSFASDTAVGADAIGRGGRGGLGVVFSTFGIVVLSLDSSIAFVFSKDAPSSTATVASNSLSSFVIPVFSAFFCMTVASKASIISSTTPSPAGTSSSRPTNMSEVMRQSPPGNTAHKSAHSSVALR